MIQFVENDRNKQRLLQRSATTAFGCKMAAIVRSYGFDKGFACFWLEEKSDCAYCLMDGLLIVSGAPADQAEAREFVQAIGPDAVIGSKEAVEALGLTATAQGEILKKSLPEDTSPVVSEEAPIRDIYNLLEACHMVDEFEPFYLDLSLKLRRGTALAVTEYRDKALAGCAVVSAIGYEAAVLSALAVDEPLRGQGIGSRLLAAVEARLPGKTLYIFREQDKNGPFYHKHQYVHEDDWIYAERKEDIRGTLL